MAGEFDFVEWVRAQGTLRERTAAGLSVLVPPGDDLAVLRWTADDLLLVGVDQALDGVHFRSAEHSPRQVGRKVMNRNLSDCAAMACLPAAAVATVALPRQCGEAFAQELYLGLRDAADLFDCPIVGGDTASWDGPLAVTVTILGRSAGVTPIERRGARPGDRICVTGPLGGSILGRHMTFTPRVDLARRLAKTGLVTAMIDISDGLSRDLGHLCRESAVGAVLRAEQIPIHPDAHSLTHARGGNAIDHALNDGEDHELVFAASGAIDPSILAADESMTEIGWITADRDVWIDRDGRRLPLHARGWEHAL